MKPTLADRFFEQLNKLYQRCLHACLHHKARTVVIAFAALIGSLFLFTRLGAEFIPTLDEGDFAMQMTLPAGSSLSESIKLSEEAEKTLMDQFPEIKHVVAKIGTAEVPTDPMAVEDADVMIIMKPFKEWTSATSRAEMVEKMKEALEPLSERAEFNFSQPIQLRFNELMTGAKADIAVKLYGEDTHELYQRAKEAATYVEKVPGAADVIVEQTMGLPQLVVKYNRGKIARYGINIEELNTIIRTAYAGEASGVVFENERKFDLVVRLDQEKVADLNLDKLFVRTSEGIQIPVGEVASIELAKRHQYADDRHSGSTDADSADLVFRFQEHYLYIDGILHRPAVTYRRYRSPLAARTPVQHLGRSRFHRLVRCGCTERYPDGEPFQRTS